MQQRLTRTLCKLMLCLAFVGTLPVQASLSSEEQARYLLGLKKQYQTHDERKALLAHSNALLKRYELKAGYQAGVAPSQRTSELYSLQVSAPGELLLRKQVQRAQSNDLTVTHERLSVFGLDPFISYDCPNHAISCSLLNPADGTVLVRIVRDHQGAAELAKSLSFLIRNLQRN